MLLFLSLGTDTYTSYTSYTEFHIVLNTNFANILKKCYILLTHWSAQIKLIDAVSLNYITGHFRRKILKSLICWNNPRTTDKNKTHKKYARNLQQPHVASFGFYIKQSNLGYKVVRLSPRQAP